MIEDYRSKRSKPASAYIPKEETLLFYLKRGMDIWDTRIHHNGYELPESLKGLIWELLVYCADYVRDAESKIPRETYRIATEIGRRVSEKLERREAVEFFRDMLKDALIQELSEFQGATGRIQDFFFAVGDAVWECYAEQLRSSIRQERRQRMTEQLRVAKRIQQHLLPKSIPEIEGFDFAGRLVPAEEVGGDYWSIKSYPQDGLVTMKLADVTGHGIAAATLVAAVKFISGGFYRGATCPAEVMERTNHVLVKETPSDILVTMIYGWLIPESRQIRLVNAGHYPVFFATQDGFKDVGPTGPLLGLHESVYDETVETFESGDILVFTSDGIIEAGADRPFGADRLKEVVWENRGRSASEIANAVLDAVMSFGVAVSDDLSIVVTKAL